MFRTKQCRLIVFLAAMIVPVLSRAQPSSPFSVSAAMEVIHSTPAVHVRVEIPPHHFIYAEHFSVKAAGSVDLRPASVPLPTKIFDSFSEEDKEVYQSSFDAYYRLPPGVEAMDVIVSYQGCGDSICYFPETKTFSLSFSNSVLTASQVAAEPSSAATATNDWRSLIDRFRVAGRTTGYMNAADLVAFLDRASGSSRAGPSSEESGVLARVRRAADLFNADPLQFFNRFGMAWTALLILLGGIALNLTPCVLPMIPINLAIIGAGARAGSRGRGFLLGAAYGLGIALVYGLLGLAVVLTGSKFGTLNASPWFNACIAVLFVVLALGMFDVFSIDFSRFQGRVGAGGGGKGGRFGVALAMGAVAALLAGACVAPVVISVILLAGMLYAKGVVVGLALPFLLGLGMALPWPFAGAGLSFLPKPGRWMTWVKYAFGVLILLMALYYAHLAWTLFRADSRSGEGSGVVAADMDRTLTVAVKQALADRKPLFLDFWATWCKNCLAMDETTFKDPEVQARLKEFVVVKYQAETPSAPPACATLDRFGAVGLPTYVVLVPLD